MITLQTDDVSRYMSVYFNVNKPGITKTRVNEDVLGRRFVYGALGFKQVDYSPLAEMLKGDTSHAVVLNLVVPGEGGVEYTLFECEGSSDSLVSGLVEGMGCLIITD